MPEDIRLIYESEEGPLEIGLESGRVSFGRGSDADYRFPDSGLSRVHATVYFEDGMAWVVDENSTNGTFVNGNPVGASGTPIEDGDIIKIGHESRLRVVASAAEQTAESASNSTVVETAPSVEAVSDRSSLILPIAIIGVSLLLIFTAFGVIGLTMWPTGNENVTARRDRDIYGTSDPDPDESPDATETPTGSSSVDPNPTGDSQSPDANPTVGPSVETSIDPALPKKQYRSMTPDEQSLYVKIKAEKVARLIGNKSSGDIPPAAVAAIKRFVDQYASRVRASRTDDCSGRGYLRSDMISLLNRAAKNTPFITRSFRSQAVDPQIGIYIAMIESEHCVCLQSHTGPLGMFQFTKATAEAYGLQVRSGATPANPDQRCEPQPASLASAKYLKFLAGRLGTGPLSIPLAIASYNSGEGGLGKNLMTALTQNASEERSFWTLVANAERLSEQFQHENIKYVPKFFAAAIIGENPRDFGVEMEPISSYTK